MDETQERYQRQLVLKELGESGQQKLFDAFVLVAGCGALGSTQAHLLVRSGVGRVRLVDRDVPELSNLHRQLLYDEDDVAAKKSKAEVAAVKLARANSHARIEPVVASMGADNLESLVADVDVVLDATDNFETRYVLNDACVKLSKPWVYGGVLGSTGMCLPVVPGKSACLRCLFPEPPKAGSLPTPETEGILNTVPAAVAAFQVSEAFRILTGAGPGTDLRLLDLWQGTVRTVPVLRDPDCPCCGRRRFEFLDGS